MTDAPFDAGSTHPPGAVELRRPMPKRLQPAQVHGSPPPVDADRKLRRIWLDSAELAILTRPEHQSPERPGLIHFLGLPGDVGVVAAEFHADRHWHRATIRSAEFRRVAVGEVVPAFERPFNAP